MPGEGPDKRQHALTHEAPEADEDHDTHGVADERATVLQPDGEEVKESSQQVESTPPQDH